MLLNFYAFTKNNIPLLEDRIPGSIYFIDTGEQLIVKSDKTFLPVSSIERFSTLEELQTANPANPDKLYAVGGRVYLYFNGEYRDSTVEQRVLIYQDFEDLVLNGTEENNKVYLTEDGKVFIYSSGVYQRISRDLEKNKKERFEYSLQGEVISSEVSFDNFATISLRRDYEYDAQELIVKETVTDFGNKIRTENSFFYDSEENIVNIETQVEHL